MSHYETFVVRLWINSEAELGHGEIRHLGTGSAWRFRQTEQMLKFIEDHTRALTRRPAKSSAPIDKSAP